MRSAVLAAAVLAASLVTAADASAGTKPPTCWTTTENADHSSKGRLLWTYKHSIAWCGDGTQVTMIDTPDVEARAVDPSCVWIGVKETQTTPHNDTWATFSMGIFSCKNGKVTQGFNPWVIVTVHPDGSHTVDSGTETAT